MTMGHPSPPPFNPTRALLLVAGALLLLSAALYNEVLGGLLAPDGSLAQETVGAIRRVQGTWIAVGVLCFGLAFVLGRATSLERFARREGVARVVLTALVVALPLFVAESALRPWFERDRTTTLFIPDADLGWKHRPNVETEWEGAAASINSKGLRGPEVAYQRAEGTRRLLYLGDSVTFGDKLDDHSDSFPYRVEEILAQAHGVSVETVNGAVSGYSTWQEYRWFRDEGVRYAPDIVVIGFVLNDVTEWLELTRFGGAWKGWQLWYSRSPFQHILGRSAVGQAVQRLVARIRFDGDVQAGAVRKEVLAVETLVDDPTRPEAEAAWAATLNDLQSIFDLAVEEGISPVLVVFPYAFQLERDADDGEPQRLLRTYAEGANVPVLDLLPPLREAMRASGLTVNDLFIDTNHLTPVGNGIVAKILADFLRRRGQLSMRSTP